MASYTVVIVPLQSSINSLDALRFFLWVKNLQELERERDALCLGLQALEQAWASLSYRQENSPRQEISTAPLWAQMQRINRTLHSLMCSTPRSPMGRVTPRF
ncbi:suppressor APC domain-containing protein 1-like [Astyanax mexicanus]|uniref:Suppressor APC domain-containing protein 1-like n=1 Tax=Astyanax mexicanus TaxID=7994 RepID=A0A8T2LKF5_ASTMX|nr:suppressor APC domain-containing protein 1-like [Astyanax mexicanus]